MDPATLRLEALKLAVAACGDKGDPDLVIETAKRFLEVLTTLSPLAAANRKAA